MEITFGANWPIRNRETGFTAQVWLSPYFLKLIKFPVLFTSSTRAFIIVPNAVIKWSTLINVGKFSILQNREMKHKAPVKMPNLVSILYYYSQVLIWFLNTLNILVFVWAESQPGPTMGQFCVREACQCSIYAASFSTQIICFILVTKAMNINPNHKRCKWCKNLTKSYI